MSKTASRYVKNKGSRVLNGNAEIINDNLQATSDFNVNWFKPKQHQQPIVYSLDNNDLTIVQGASGSGKSTTAIWKALKDLKAGVYEKIVFVKTPSEDGDDKIGYLTGDANEKLKAHFEAMRSIFLDFMSVSKLEYEEKRGRISFTIPNFLAGKTFYKSLVIIDESQKISPNTLKLLLERGDDNTRFVVLGDRKQRYAKDKRNDGLSDLLWRVDLNGIPDNVGVIFLDNTCCVRSRLSKTVLDLYDLEEEQ